MPMGMPPTPVNPALMQEQIKALMRTGLNQQQATQKAAGLTGPAAGRIPSPRPPAPPQMAPSAVPAAPPAQVGTQPVGAPQAMPSPSATPSATAPAPGASALGTTAPTDGAGVAVRKPRSGQAAGGPTADIEQMLMAQQSRAPGVPY